MNLTIIRELRESTQIISGLSGATPSQVADESRGFASIRELSGSDHLPGLPVRARQQLARFGVAHNDFLGDVPLDLPPDQHRDEPEVTGNGRMMRDLDRGNRRLAGLDALNEIGRAPRLNSSHLGISYAV